MQSARKTPALPKAGMSQADAGMFRLMHDIAECMRDPIDGIQLVVHDNNMRKMCAVLTPTDDAYAGIRLHLSVCIPDNYPTSSPQISIDTPIPHPNIFGSYICCSILKGRLVRSWDAREVSGYTPAYPLQTILAQLLSFFTADVVEQEYFSYKTRRERPSPAVLRECVSGFSCSHCGYGPPTGVIRACRSCGAKPRPTPPGASKSGSASQKCSSCGATRAFESTPKILSFYPIPQTLSPRPKVLSHRPKTPKSTGHPAAISRVSRSTGDRGSSPCVLDRLLPDIWHMIFLHLGSKDVSTLAAVYPKILKSVNIDAIVARRNLRCFYLRSDFTESILGVGVWILHARYSSEFDVLSSFAFSESEVRESPWGQDFSHFLPLAINQAHFERARPGIEAAVMALNWRDASNFDPDLIIPTFARWMNQMVVDLMHEVTETAYGTYIRGGAKPLLHASDKALTGYCVLMHLLLVLVQTYPQVLPATYARVNGFLSDPALRHKRRVPDLGELLVCLALVPNLSWDAVRGPLLNELLTRNVVWCLNAHPHLAYLEPHDFVSRRRLDDTFRAARTGLRLFLFQVHFLKNLVWTRTQAVELASVDFATAVDTSSQPSQRPPSPSNLPVVETCHPNTLPSPALSFAAAAASAASASRPSTAKNDNRDSDGGDWVLVQRKLRKHSASVVNSPNKTPQFSEHTRAAATAHIDALIAASAETYGFPTARRAAALAAYARAVLRVENFGAFFSLLDADGPTSPAAAAGVPSPHPPTRASLAPAPANAAPPTQLAVCRALRAAVDRSLAAGYHRVPYTPAELWVMRRAVEPAIVLAGPPQGRPPSRFPARRSFFPAAVSRHGHVSPYR